MRRRWKGTVFVLAVAALFAAVFGGVSNQANATRKAASAETLKIMGFGPGDEIANVRAEVAEKALPSGSKVDNPRGGFDDQKFLAALAARDVPDVVYIDRQKVGTYAAKGAFVPLTSCIKSKKINLKQYRGSALAAVTYKKKVYAIPEFTNPRTIIVDNKVVAAAGLKPTDLKVTNWAKLAKVNKKLLKRSGGKVTRIGFDPKISDSGYLGLWAKANGVDLVSKNGLKVNFTNPKAIQALSFAYSLIKAHGGWGPFKSFRDTWDFFGAKNQVAEDQIGAWPMESFYYNVLAQNSPGVDITALPFTNRRGGALTFFSGNSWAIPKGAKNADLACTWMKSMTATATWVKAAKERFDAQRRRGRPFTGVFTANKAADIKIYQDIYQPMGNKDFDKAVDLLAAINRYGFERPASPAGAEIDQAAIDAVNRVLSGKQSPKKAMQQAQREATKAIKNATK
jgi:multiple sugar transport system substrate-binding protein